MLPNHQGDDREWRSVWSPVGMPTDATDDGAVVVGVNLGSGQVRVLHGHNVRNNPQSRNWCEYRRAASEAAGRRAAHRSAHARAAAARRRAAAQGAGGEVAVGEGSGPQRAADAPGGGDDHQAEEGPPAPGRKARQGGRRRGRGVGGAHPRRAPRGRRLRVGAGAALPSLRGQHGRGHPHGQAGAQPNP